MVVGIVRVDLHIHGCSSLKEKRSVVRRIRDRARSRHNISAAEVDQQDLLQSATLGFAAVGHSEDVLRRLFGSLREMIEDLLPGGVESWEEDLLS